MSLRVHLATCLTLTALGLAPGAAHIMELPVKVQYASAFYAQVTSTLYTWYGAVGGAVQVLAAITAIALAIRLRRSPPAGLAAAAAAALVISLALWGALVAPVNLSWASAPRDDPVAFAAAYEDLRWRWEYGHVSAFVAWLAGWFGLVAVATREPAPSRGTAFLYR